MNGTGDGDGPWRVVQAGVVMLAAAFFLYSLRDLLNPFVLYWILVALLHPFRGRAGYSLILGTATVVALLWVLETTGSLLAPFILAFVLAYILDPLVDRISAVPRIGRSVAILLILVPVVAGVVAALVFGAPALAGQVTELIEQVPALVERLEAWTRTLDSRTLGVDLPFVDEETLVARLQAIDGEAVVAFLEARREEIASRAWSAVLGLGRGVGAVLTILGYVVLTPVLMFYLLRDFDVITRRIADLVPVRMRGEAAGFFGEYDSLLSKYLRGQVSVAMLVGMITWLGLFVLGFPYAFLLGITVAVLGVVPYLGLVLSLIPAVLIALVSGNVLLSLVKVAVVFGAAQGLEGAVISPRIVGDSVGLHPVWILLALSLGGFFFGFVGLLIGVPLAVGVKLTLVRLLDRYKRSALYGEGPAVAG